MIKNSDIFESARLPFDKKVKKRKTSKWSRKFKIENSQDPSPTLNMGT